MAAAKAKTSNLVVSKFTPNVAQAAGLSRIACNRRPNGPRRNHTTKRPNIQKKTVIVIKNPASCSKLRPRKLILNSLVMSWPKTLRFSILRPSPPNTSGWSKIINSASRAKAKEAKARYKPCNRRAGKAISIPKGVATSAATNKSHGLPGGNSVNPNSCPPTP